MIEYKKVFVDTAPFIYYLENNPNNPQYFEKIKHFFMGCYQNDTKIISSVITTEEYYVFPYRNGRMDYIAMFEKLVKTLNIDIVHIDETTAKKAAEIRAQYRHFKAMDALQLATACLKNCDLFLTNDKQLKNFRAINCITMDEL